MSKHKIKEFLSAVGDSRVMDAIGVSEYSIRHVKRDGKFPASWFPIITRIADEEGFEIGPECFNFKQPTDVGTEKQKTGHAEKGGRDQTAIQVSDEKYNPGDSGVAAE